MKRLSNRTDQLLHTFYEITGIGALCFDTHLNIVAHQPSKRISDDFVFLGLQRITAFLSQKYPNASKQERLFYTFTLESNLICNIAFLCRDGQCSGAFVTQPVLIKRMEPEKLEQLLGRLNLHSTAREILRADLFKIPVVSYDKIILTGRILSSLSETFFNGEETRQVLCGGESDTVWSNASPVYPLFKTGEQEEASQRHSSFSTYLQLKESIQKGDTELLLDIMNSLDAGSIPMDQLDRQDFVRSLKNSFIKTCAMACFMAIEANAPFYKMMDFADEQIRKMEKLENINDIYELMKNTMIAFARAVSVTRLTSYSKPVRQVMDYIEMHYAEKITLDMLAEHAKLSPSYLSNLIKKETGRNLADNINKVRIQQSEFLLMNTNLGISEVAREVGFHYQNHFASIFKKFTGNSPTEFKNLIGFTTVEDDSHGMLSLLVGPVRNMLLKFPGFCDMARIVDPASHRFWMIRQGEENLLNGTCYDFWKRGVACENCISARAYIEGHIQYKIDRSGQNVFLALAVPRTAGKNIYIVELLKNITEDIDVPMGSCPFQSAPAAEQPDTADLSEEYAGLRSRIYIDQMLPKEIRSSRINGEQFSFLLLALASDFFPPVTMAGENEELLQGCKNTIAALARKHGGWAGHYIGNIFLISLKRTDHKTACRIGERIKNELEQFLQMQGEGSTTTGPRKKIIYSVKTFPDQAADAGSLIQSAWTELCTAGLDHRLYG